MKLSVLNSICFLLLLSSCTYSAYKQDDPYAASGFRDVPSLGWFEGNTNCLFNTSVEIFKNRYSGLLVIKHEISGSNRVVLITEFGLKIFDMEFFPGGDFRLHYCMEAINKDYIINMLRKDFELIFRSRPSKGSSVMLAERKTGGLVLKEKENAKKYYFYIDGNTGRVSNIIKASPLGKKTRADFYGKKGNVPDSVSIEHYNIKLNIKLDLIDESLPSADA